MSEEEKIRKSKITKSVTKKYTTSIPYEIVEVSVWHEEEIEWKNIEERNKKVDNLTKAVIVDFKKTKDEVFKNLNIKDAQGNLTQNNTFNNKVEEA